MRDSTPVVFVIREPLDGFAEDITPLRDEAGRIRTFPDDATAEKVAARLDRTKMVTPSAYLRGTTFVAGWIPNPPEPRVPWVEVDQTAYGSTVRLSRSVRVF